MVTKLFVTWTYIVAIWSNLLVPCATSDNWKYCTKDWDVWLWPEIQRAWDIKQGYETPYQEEQEVLQSNKVEL